MVQEAGDDLVQILAQRLMLETRAAFALAGSRKDIQRLLKSARKALVIHLRDELILPMSEPSVLLGELAA
ncbi:MAG: hypothetical protein C5B60_00385 [Chloroflexi bacterium]|nr:MAG: hypothetical protein C5B60_00385 [Chloroflexota bacterium]